MKKWRMGILLAVLLLAALASTAVAMTSTHYILGWYSPMTTGSGSNMTSASSQLSLSTGQVGVGYTLTSTNYRVWLGYWAGVSHTYTNFVPAIRKP